MADEADFRTMAALVVELVSVSRHQQRTIVHDLRSAMTPVLGQLSLAALPTKPESERLEHLEKAQRAAQVLKKRLDDPLPSLVATRVGWGSDGDPKVELAAALQDSVPIVATHDRADGLWVSHEAATAVALAVVIAAPTAARVLDGHRLQLIGVNADGSDRQVVLEWLANSAGADLTWEGSALGLSWGPHP